MALLQMNNNIDTIVLGCTHYPVVKEYIESIVPNHIKIIGQGNIVADSLADYLIRHPWMDAKCTKNGSVHFLTTESKLEFDQNATQYFKEEGDAAQAVEFASQQRVLGNERDKQKTNPRKILPIRFVSIFIKVGIKCCLFYCCKA